MTISAEMIKDLRARSGAGIMECKDALKQTEGDTEEALDYLRKKGSSAAEKKAGRSTREGAVGGAVTGGSGSLIEVKCETDFVARNEKFQELVKNLAEHLVKSEFVEDEDSFMDQPFSEDASHTVKSVITEKIRELGENIAIGRRALYQKSDPGGFGMYIHGVGGIGVIVEVSCATQETADNEAFRGLCRDLAMHVAASNPLSIGIDDLPPEVVAREKEIFEAQARESGKPDKIIPKIIEGKLKKYYKEVCLLEQAFVKDTDKSVKGLLEEAGKEMGEPVAVTRFSRFQLGE
ncbi:MAG TPA: elongation factor Ts [Nitrospirae bacterium]|nr:elongation factor Ts [Nitrospirota bacterium]